MSGEAPCFDFNRHHRSGKHVQQTIQASTTCHRASHVLVLPQNVTHYELLTEHSLITAICTIYVRKNNQLHVAEFVLRR